MPENYDLTTELFFCDKIVMLGGIVTFKCVDLLLLGNPPEYDRNDVRVLAGAT